MRHLRGRPDDREARTRISVVAIMGTEEAQPRRGVGIGKRAKAGAELEFHREVQRGAAISQRVPACVDQVAIAIDHSKANVRDSFVRISFSR